MAETNSIPSLLYHKSSYLRPVDVETIKRCQISVTDFEIVEPRVLFDALPMSTLRQGNPALLETVTKQDLRR